MAASASSRVNVTVRDCLEAANVNVRGKLDPQGQNRQIWRTPWRRLSCFLLAASQLIGQREYCTSGYHALLGPKHTEKICEGEHTIL